MKTVTLFKHVHCLLVLSYFTASALFAHIHRSSRYRVDVFKQNRRNPSLCLITETREMSDSPDLSTKSRVPRLVIHVAFWNIFR